MSNLGHCRVPRGSRVRDQETVAEVLRPHDPGLRQLPQAAQRCRRQSDAAGEVQVRITQYQIVTVHIKIRRNTLANMRMYLHGGSRHHSDYRLILVYQFLPKTIDWLIYHDDHYRFFPAWSAATLEPLDMNDALSALYGLFQGTVQYNAVDWSVNSHTLFESPDSESWCKRNDFFRF